MILEPFRIPALNRKIRKFALRIFLDGKGLQGKMASA